MSNVFKVALGLDFLTAISLANYVSCVGNTVNNLPAWRRQEWGGGRRGEAEGGKLEREEEGWERQREEGEGGRKRREGGGRKEKERGRRKEGKREEGRLREVGRGIATAVKHGHPHRPSQ